MVRFLGTHRSLYLFLYIYVVICKVTFTQNIGNFQECRIAYILSPPCLPAIHLSLSLLSSQENGHVKHDCSCQELIGFPVRPRRHIGIYLGFAAKICHNSVTLADPELPLPARLHQKIKFSLSPALWTKQHGSLFGYDPNPQRPQAADTLQKSGRSDENRAEPVSKISHTPSQQPPVAIVAIVSVSHRGNKRLQDVNYLMTFIEE